MRAAAMLALVAAGLLTTPSIGETTMTHAMLTVPGAEIYYETQGSGPVLLVIPGGPQDAGVFSEMAALLADRYTVVTYDPRGNSRTRLAAEPGELDVDQQADDAVALIAAAGAPAHVFGTSGGAQIGLSLAARHPELVRTLVAHEPPSMMLLDDPSEALAADEAIYQTYLAQGVDAAMGRFFAMNGLEEVDGDPEAPQFEMPPEAAETFARVSGNFEYWLRYGMKPLGHYTPDVATLKTGKPRVVVAIGERSVGQPIHAMGTALAERLGLEPTVFPGDHMGFGPEAAAFAEAVDAALR